MSKWKRKPRTTESYGVRPYEMRGSIPTAREIFIGGTYGEGARKGREVNPATIFQSMRQAMGTRPTFTGVHLGMWGGKPEKSYSYRSEANKQRIEQLRQKTGQSSIYSEDPHGYYLHGAGGEMEITHFKYVITVRKKPNMNTQSVINAISSMVGNGTYSESPAVIRFETALFYGSEKTIVAGKVQQLIQGLRNQGIYATTSVQVAKTGRSKAVMRVR